MDTFETNEAPVGVEGATSSQDTASQVETQPSETEATVSDSQSGNEGEASETLFAGKYKNPQELEKAYMEAQKAMGQLSQKAGLVNQLEKSTGMNAQQIAEFLEKQQQQQLQQQIQDNPAGYAIKEVETLRQQIALQNEERELDKFLQENPDYAPFRDKIFNLGLKLETDKSYEEIAKEYFGNARAQGQQDAYKKIETKKMTQATGASQAAPKTGFTPEEMDRMSAEELEAILPHADISHRLY
jgi:hypothetical protein